MHDDVVLMIRGELVGLGPIRSDLVHVYQRWMNDLRVTRTLGVGSRPMTAEAEEDWLRGAVHTSDVVFTIWELESMRPLGNAGLHQISLVHDTAFFGIFIGDPDAWGKGYGTEVTRLVLGYGFDVLGLHNIRLEVFSNNPRAVRVYERAGFKHAGTIRGGRKVGRERHDIIMMDAVADDFPPSALHETMQP